MNFRYFTNCVFKIGKGESIWDRFCHEPGHILANDVGDDTCDSYRLYNEDIRLIQNLGVSVKTFVSITVCLVSFFHSNLSNRTQIRPI
jgi:Glycosyl hydrolase family 1